MSHNPFDQFVSNKYFEQMNSRSFTSIVDGKFGNINVVNVKSDKGFSTSIMDAFRKSLSLGENMPDIKNPHLSEFILKYENRLTDNFTLKNNNKCVACHSREPCSSGKLNRSTFDINGYLFDILCDVCIKRMQASKEYACSRPKQNLPSSKPSSDTSSEVPLPKQNIKPNNSLNGNRTEAKIPNSEDEMHYYWIEVRNSIYQIFLQEGFLLNPVVMRNINPPVFSSYVMPSNAMLKVYVKKLFHANKHKLFLLTVCHVQLFIMEIKLRLLKELMELKPYFIFPLFYTLFERLLRALQRTNLFLDIIENEFLKKNKLHWFNIHLLFFQTFVYMNRFIQKSISLLCDCSTENGLKTNEDEDSRIVGRFVYRSYIILEQSMASFSLYTNTHSNNFAVFFSKFDDFQLLFQFAILLFNCKNYDENIFSRRFFSTDFNVKSLQDMPHLVKDLLIKDALSTNMFQLFLVIHHWDNTEVFDNVMKRLPNVEVSRSSRSIIKTILTESFIEVGYDEPTLLEEFFSFIEQDMPDDCCFEDYLAQEIVLSDEENFDEELSVCSEDSHHCFSHFRHGHHHDCDCYSEMFCHSEHWFPTARRNFEMRDRLRQRLTQRKVQQSHTDNPKGNSSANGSEGNPTDDRDLDDLLNFINGSDCDNKKRKKSRKKKPKSSESAIENVPNQNGCLVSTVHEEIQKEEPKSKKKKNKKQKNKDKNGQNDENDECNDSLCNATEQCFIEQNKSLPEKEMINSELQCTEFIIQTESDENSNEVLPEMKFDTSNLDDVFKPKDIDLDSEDLDEFEKELEKFKRFCYNSMSNHSCKPKLIIDVKDIFNKKLNS